MIHHIDMQHKFPVMELAVKSGSTVTDGELVKLTSGTLEKATTGATTFFGVALKGAASEENASVLVFDAIPTIEADWTGTAPTVGDACSIDSTAKKFTTASGSGNGLVLKYDSVSGRATVMLKSGVLVATKN